MAIQIQLLIMFRVFLAFLAGVLVGYDRERSGKAAGIRTQMLVCVGSALLSGISVYLGKAYGQTMADPARLMAQVVSGIGFLGAGVILKNGGGKLSGVTTAATIWTTAAIGVGIGAGFYLPSFATVVLVLMLNPIALWQYKIGLKGENHILIIEKKDALRVQKLLKKLRIGFRKTEVKGKKMEMLIFSYELKNKKLASILNRRKIEFELGVLGDGEN